MPFFQGYGRDSKSSGLHTCQGSLYKKSKIIGTSKKPPGTAKKANTAKMAKRVIFKRDSSLDAIFSQVMRETQSFLDSEHVRVSGGTNQRQIILNNIENFIIL